MRELSAKAARLGTISSCRDKKCHYDITGGTALKYCDGCGWATNDRDDVTRSIDLVTCFNCWTKIVWRALNEWTTRRRRRFFQFLMVAFEEDFQAIQD